MAKNKKISVPLKNAYDSDPKFNINNPQMSAEELIEAHLNDEENEIALEHIRNQNLKSAKEQARNQSESHTKVGEGKKRKETFVKRFIKNPWTKS